MIGNHLEPFKFWCQKVLPNVYDDSLSYYEYLCKLNEYLNEVIGQINTLTDNMEDYETDLSAQWLDYKTDLTNQWTETKNYIDHYFDNLNVQTEINNKLDAMALDGSLSALITPELPDIVGNWLSTHLTPTEPTIDNTLSVSGAGADAKVTGNWLRGGVGTYDTILSLNDDLNSLTEGVYNMYPQSSSYYSNMPSDIVINKRYLLFAKGAWSYPFQIIMSQDRMTYVRSKSNGNWSAWIKLIDNRQTIPANTDLNNLSIQGEYNFYYENNYTNVPSDLPNPSQNIVVTFGTSPYITQMLYNNNRNLYVRHYTGSAWNSWTPIKDLPIMIAETTNLNSLANGYYNSNVITNLSTDYPNKPNTLVLNSSFFITQNGISGRHYQVLYASTGRVYYRFETGVAGTWHTWYTANDERMVLSANTDLNNLTNGEYNFFYQNNLTNAPSELPTNSVILINVLGTAPNYFQILYYSKNVYMRYYGASWSNWITLNERRWIIPTGTDLNNLTNGVYNFYSASGAVLNGPDTLPVNAICIVEVLGTAPYLFEVIYTSTGYTYQRYNNGSTWTPWIETIKTSDYMQRIDSLGAFHKFGVVGDSMSSGYAKVEPNHSYDFIEYSWVQVAKRRLGNEMYNFTKSGLTTRTWLTDAKGYAVMSDGNHDAQGYAIMLGVNDKNVLGSDYLGTSADIDLEDYTQDADTFYGNYARIISLIKVQVPSAKIFVFTMPYTDTLSTSFNTAIEYMATIFTNVYVVHLKPAMFSANSFIGKNAVDGHYSPVGWIAIANYVMEEIANVMYENASDFFYVEKILTQWDT